MHWTLQTLIGLCLACALLNAVQLVMVRSVRTIGVLICFAWVIQQSYWLKYHSDSLALFILCDVAIIGWFLSRRRAFDLRERIIAAIVPVTTAIGGGGHLAGGLSENWWWFNWSLVAVQMVLGLPWPQLQRSLGSFSHGRLRSITEA